MGCAISAGNMLVPGGMIRKTPNFCVHQDPLVPLPGFIVIATTRHIHSISEMQTGEYEEFSSLLWIVERAIKEVTKVEYLTLVQEENSVHFHLWFFPWNQNVIKQYGAPSLTKIRDIITDQRKHPIGKVEWKELERSIEKIKAQMNNV